MLMHEGGSPFTVGMSRFFDHSDEKLEATAKIFVKIAAGSLGLFLAQLDTGAAWSLLNVEIAEELSLLGGNGEQALMRTHGGAIHGRLEKARIRLLADERCGQSLNIEATFLVSEDWNGGNFLGYSGFLDHIRFAIDPRERSFHFGPLA